MAATNPQQHGVLCHTPCRGETHQSETTRRARVQKRLCPGSLPWRTAPAAIKKEDMLACSVERSCARACCGCKIQRDCTWLPSPQRTHQLAQAPLVAHKAHQIVDASPLAGGEPAAVQVNRGSWWALYWACQPVNLRACWMAVSPQLESLVSLNSWFWKGACLAGQSNKRSTTRWPAGALWGLLPSWPSSAHGMLLCYFFFQAQPDAHLLLRCFKCSASRLAPVRQASPAANHTASTAHASAAWPSPAPLLVVVLHQQVHRSASPHVPAEKQAEGIQASLWDDAAEECTGP